MSKHWNDEVIELERQYVDNLTGSQSVASGVSREGWDLRWEVERLQKAVDQKDEQIGRLRYEVAMLKAELNATRGRKV